MTYELTTIVADESTDNPVPKLLASVKTELLHDEATGRRKFAYPIGKLTSGVYHRFTIQADPSTVATLDEALRRDGSVLRHLIVTQQYEPPIAAATVVDEAAIEALGDVTDMTRKAEAAAKEKSMQSAPAVPKLAGVETVQAPDEAQAQPTEPPVAQEETTSADAAAVKDESVVDEATRQAELDKKLDQILGKNKEA